MDERMKNLNLAEILKDFPEGTKLYSPIFGEVELVKVYNDGNYPIEVRLSNSTLDSFTMDGRIYMDYDGECMLFPGKDQRDWSKFTAPWYNIEKQDKQKKQVHFPKFTFDDVLALQCCMETVKKVQEDKELYEKLNLIHSKIYDAYWFEKQGEQILSQTNPKKDKFDPKTLQPFDLVLVRDSNECQWRCAFYSHKREDYDSPYKYVATSSIGSIYCIPYNDDTKHLAGTSKEAPEYYRYWEE